VELAVPHALAINSRATPKAVRFMVSPGCAFLMLYVQNPHLVRACSALPVVFSFLRSYLLGGGVSDGGDQQWAAQALSVNSLPAKT
jgi:hypothetical protein